MQHPLVGPLALCYLSHACVNTDTSRASSAYKLALVSTLDHFASLSKLYKAGVSLATSQLRWSQDMSCFPCPLGSLPSVVPLCCPQAPIPSCSLGRPSLKVLEFITASSYGGYVAASGKLICRCSGVHGEMLSGVATPCDVDPVFLARYWLQSSCHSGVCVKGLCSMLCCCVGLLGQPDRIALEVSASMPGQNEQNWVT